MKTPPPWQDEKQRLGVLGQYAVLDTPPEEAFDNLTALAAQICKAPIALISLVDENRQWFKSKVGLTASETARDISFCGHGIHQSGLFIVPDATRDERFADNPLVTAEPRIRFYAGAPLVSPEGQALGMLCVIDHVPRKLSAGQQESLRVLSRQVMAQLELRRHARELARVQSDRDRLMKAEKELLQGEFKYRTLFETANDAILLLRQDRFIDCNARTLTVFDCSREQIIGAPPYKFSPPKQPDGRRSEEKVLEKINLALTEGPQFFEWEHCRLDRTPFRAEVSLNRVELGGETLLQAIVRDITERKRVEETLRQSEEQFRLIMENLADLVAVLDLDGRRLYNSPSYRGILGDPYKLLGTSSFDQVHPEDRAQVQEAFQETVRTGVGQRLEYRMVGQDGQSRHIESQGSVIRDDRGQVSKVVVVSRDVTQRKRTEEILQERERRFRAIFNSTFQFTGLLTPDGTLIEANQAALDFAGIKIEEIIHRPFWEARWWQGNEARVRQLREAITRAAGGEFVRYEVELQGTGETTVIIDFSLKPVFDPAGQVTLLIPEGRDITERKRADAALQENQRQLAEANQMLQMVMDTIPVRIFWKNKDLVYLGCNRLFAEDAGLKSPEDILGKTDYNLGWREQAELYRKDDMEVVRSGNSKLNYEEPQTAPDGKQLWLRTSKIPLRDINNRIIGILGTYEDITARKQAEEALRQSEAALDKANRELQRDVAEHRQMQKRLGESERKARAIFDLSFGFIGLLTPDGLLVEANRSALDFAGVQLSDVVGKPFWETPWWAHSTDEQERIRAAVRTAAGGELMRFETTHLATDGAPHTIDFSLKPLKDEAGRVVLLIPQGRDITERKRAEEAHARLATAVEQAAEAIVITDTSGQILYVNPAFEKTSGYTRQEAVGKNPRILKSGKHEDAFYHQMWETLTQGKVWSGRIINKKKNGALYEEEMTISPIRDSAGKVINYVAVNRDVTQEVALEEQLRQAQKMESIGQLAGGVAHDFNNILVVIQGNASLLLDAKNLSEADVDLAKQILNAAERAAGLTRQLLMFGRKQVMQPAHLNLNQVVGNMTKILQRILGEDIALRSDYTPILPLVFADAGMIEQVLLNLAVNARDAMPAGGRLMIATASKTIGQEYAQQNPAAAPGQCVCLSVSDTGCGIPPEHLSHIFEPFFTTKEIGKGTGLGLATVYGIVKQHRGWIEIDSQVGKGTTFRIYLPAVRDVTAKQKTTAVTAELPRGDEVILVVEDEQAVRLLVGNLLQRCGYTVLLAVSGIEALNLWEQHKDEIQLLLTDMVLPDGMMGRELAEKLKGEKPKLKVVYTSGYSASVVGKGPSLVEGVNFLQKPYHPQKLAQTVRDCLDQREDGGKSS